MNLGNLCDFMQSIEICDCKKIVSYLLISFPRRDTSETCSKDIFSSGFCRWHNFCQPHTYTLSCFELFAWKTPYRTRRSVNHSDNQKPGRWKSLKYVLRKWKSCNFNYFLDEQNDLLHLNQDLELHMVNLLPFVPLDSTV